MRRLSASIQRSSGGTGESLIGLFRTPDLGANPTWHSLNLPGDPLDAVKVDLPRDADTTAGNSPGETYTGVNPGGQGFKNFSFAVDFNNRGPDAPSETIYLGGDRQAINNGTAGLSTTGANIFAGLDSTTRPASKNTIQWNQIVGGPSRASSLNFGRGTAPHADSRNIVIEKSGDVLEVDDGGIFRASLGTGVTLKWASPDPSGPGSLQLGELFSADYDPLTGRIIGGLWDNGVAIKTSASGNGWNEILLTDGHLVEATSSTIGGATVPTYFYSSANVTSAVFVWYDKNSNGKQDADEVVTLFVKDTGKSGTIPLIKDSDLVFARPHEGTWVVNSVDPTRMLFGGNQLWEVANLDKNPDLALARREQGSCRGCEVARDSATGRKFTALAYGAKGNPDVVYAARDTPHPFSPVVYVRMSSGGALTKTFLPNSGPAGTSGTVVDIALDPEDARIAYVVVDEGGSKPDRVYKTTDAGQHWFRSRAI